MRGERYQLSRMWTVVFAVVGLLAVSTEAINANMKTKTYVFANSKLNVPTKGVSEKPVVTAAPAKPEGG